VAGRLCRTLLASARTEEAGAGGSLPGHGDGRHHPGREAAEERLPDRGGTEHRLHPGDAPPPSPAGGGLPRLPLRRSGTSPSPGDLSADPNRAGDEDRPGPQPGVPTGELPGDDRGPARRRGLGGDTFDAAVSVVVMARHRDEILALEGPAEGVERLEGAIWGPGRFMLAARLLCHLMRTPRQQRLESQTGHPSSSPNPPFVNHPVVATEAPCLERPGKPPLRGPRRAVDYHLV